MVLREQPNTHAICSQPDENAAALSRHYACERPPIRELVSFNSMLTTRPIELEANF
jgi:hypothetical protein